jgi:alpha-beta hydrolase superfamily lysophospholipase
MRRGRWPWVVVLACVVAGTVTAGAPAGAASPPRSAGGGTTFYDPPLPLPRGRPGALIRWKPLLPGQEPGIPAGARAYLVLYHSRSIRGADVAESGVVIVPGTAPPRSGFPVVSWAHGTTGVATVCAPSRIPGLAIPGLAELVAAGDVVVAADYEGLGPPGLHPYLVGESEGRSVLDASRAATHLGPAHASNRVVIFGHSQGGQATLFAGQLAPSYAPDLHVLGVAAGAPVLDLANLLAIPTGTSPSGSVALVVTAAYAWSHTYTDLPLADLLTPAALAPSSVVDKACFPDVQRAYSSLPPTSVVTARFSTLAALKAHLRENDAGATPTRAPLLVFQGTDDTLTPADIAEHVVAHQLCAVDHDTVQLDLFAGADHGGVLPAAQDQVLSWIAGRFAGMAARSSCGTAPTMF